MDIPELTKFVTALISFLGTITIRSYNNIQNDKIRAELLSNLDDAVAAKSKHRVCELFFLIYRVRLAYPDIEKLCQNDDVGRILNALKKNPGMVRYENGNFKYVGIFKKKWFQLFGKYSVLSQKYISVAMIVFSAIGIVFGSGYVVGLFFITMIVASLFLADSYRESVNTEMISKLVKGESKTETINPEN